MVLRRIKFYMESKKKLKIVQVNITDNFCAESNSVRNRKKTNDCKYKLNGSAQN